MSTIAFGDIVPVTSAERIMTMGKCAPRSQTTSGANVLIGRSSARSCHGLRNVGVRVRDHTGRAVGDGLRPDYDRVQQQPRRAQPIHEPPPHADAHQKGLRHIK
eukprot:5302948-Prymnesium_polylepis.1